MKLTNPILFPNRYSPSTGSVIQISSGGYGSHGFWIHGRLTLSETPDSKDNPLRSVFIYGVSETDKRGFRLALDERKAFFNSRLSPGEIIRSKEGASITFSLNLLALMKDEPENDCYHVRACFHDEMSNVVELSPDSAPSIDNPKTAGDHLLKAYMSSQSGDFKTAVESFEKAFADPRIRNDFDGAHLYNGACACALAIADSPEDERALRRKMFKWLREDFRGRYGLYIKKLSKYDGDSNDMKELDSMFQEYCSSLREDPDFKSIRRHPDFQETDFSASKANWKRKNSSTNSLYRVHVSFYDAVSNILLAPPDRISTINDPETPEDSLSRAYLSAQIGDFKAAIRSFEKALADPRTGNDFEGAHLYNGARVCALAAADSPEDERALRRKMFKWLRDDFRGRYDLYAMKLFESAGYDADSNNTKELDSLFQNYCSCLREDPDFESIRRHPDFQQADFSGAKANWKSKNSPANGLYRLRASFYDAVSNIILAPPNKLLTSNSCETPEESLSNAYLSAQNRDFKEAIENFEKAFDDSEIKNDFANAHLYNGARICALAAADSPEDELALRRKMFQWLREDFSGRYDLYIKKLSESAAHGDDSNSVKELDSMFQEYCSCLREDPDFESIRRHPDFQKVDFSGAKVNWTTEDNPTNGFYRVHASFYEAVSGIILISPEKALKVNDPETPEDYLSSAYLSAQNRDFKEAIESFEKAFDDPEIKNDFANAHLYNGVRTCALAAADSAEDERPLIEKSLKWLRDDYSGRYELYIKEQIKAVVSDKDFKKQREYDVMFWNYCSCLRNDPDLELIRKHPGFHEMTLARVRSRAQV